MAPHPRPQPAAVALTPALRAELEWLAGEGPPKVARHAQIVLSRAGGLSTRAVAVAVGVHPNTVRNCMRRFESQGMRGLLHGSAGKPKNAAFSDAIRDAIARIAMHSPAAAGAPYGRWSLRRLRVHLLDRGLVDAISVEGLRQLLAALPLPHTYWRRSGRAAAPLSAEVRHALERLADGTRRDRSLRAQIVLANHRGLNEAEIAAALHIGRGTVRRWLRRFRRAGILGLQTMARGARAQRRHALRRSSMSSALHFDTPGPLPADDPAAPTGTEHGPVSGARGASPGRLLRKANG
jgi:transposase